MDQPLAEYWARLALLFVTFESAAFLVYKAALNTVLLNQHPSRALELDTSGTAGCTNLSSVVLNVYLSVAWPASCRVRETLEKEMEKGSAEEDMVRFAGPVKDPLEFAISHIKSTPEPDASLLYVWYGQQFQVWEFAVQSVLTVARSAGNR